MNTNVIRLLTYITAVGIGTVPAFFIVFNAVFTDSSGLIGERLLTFVLVTVAYGILGIAFGFVSTAVPWRLALWLSFPAFGLLAWYTTREPGQILLHLVYMIWVFVSAVAGIYAGAWARHRFRRVGS